MLINGAFGFVFFALFTYFVEEYDANPHYLKISTFLWTAPLFFLLMVYITSAKGREPLLAYTRHAILGTIISVMVYANTLLLKHRSLATIVLSNLFIVALLIYLYFRYNMYEM